MSSTTDFPNGNNTQPEQETIVSCPKCGKKLHIEDNFCSSCGYDMRKVYTEEPVGITTEGKAKTSVRIIFIILVALIFIAMIIGSVLFIKNRDRKMEERRLTIAEALKEEVSSEKEEAVSEEKTTEEVETAEKADKETTEKAKETAEKTDKEAAKKAETAEKAKKEAAKTQKKKATPTPTPKPAAKAKASMKSDADSLKSVKKNMTRLGADKIKKYSASSTIYQAGISNDAMLLLDDNTETNWQEGVDGDGIKENVLFTFDQKYSIKAVTFRLGNWRSEKLFYANNRPKVLKIRMAKKNWEIEFPDEMKEFTVTFSKPVKASAIRFVIEGVYPGNSWDDTAITDIGIWY